MEDNKKEKIRILFVGDSLSSPSGLSYVISSFMRMFKVSAGDKYSVAYCSVTGANSSINHCMVQGDAFKHAFEKDLLIYNANLLEEDGMLNFNKAIIDFRPHIVFSNLDPWNVDQIAYSIYRSSYFWVQYLTIETPFYPEVVMYPTYIIRENRKSMKDILAKADVLIPATSIGKKVLENMGLHPVDNIYNGIEMEIVCHDITKKEAFSPAIDENDFIFMTMGVNNERKKIDVVVDAFAKFLDKMKKGGDISKYKLFLHTDTDQRIGGTDLETQIINLGIQRNIIFSNAYKQGIVLYKVDLYKRYKASDCYIGLPGGEGFGYGFAEALIHGIPVIYSDYGGHTSYLKDIGLPVKIKALVNARNIYMQWAIADTDDAAIQMCKIVSDKKLRESLSKRGKQFAEKEFPWEVVFKKLVNTIESKFSEEKRQEIYSFNLKKII